MSTVSATQAAIERGVQFSATMGFTLNWPIEKVVQEMYEAAKLTAGLEEEILSDDDGFFLLDSILVHLLHMYPEQSSDDLVAVMNRFFAEKEA